MATYERSDKEKAAGATNLPPRLSLSGSGDGLPNVSKHDGTHRMLKARHIQLIGIGGTIGTALFVRTIHLQGKNRTHARLTENPVPPL